jgi:predicted ATPase/DNA-binding CsgD family transcriptional regulator
VSDSAGASATPHLRVPLTSFIGREAETADLRRLLNDSRLVTLSGAGGLGKTRLALHVAGQLAGAFADGVCQVDFAPIADPDLVPPTVARALGLSDQPGRSPVDTLLDFIADLKVLLLLDNCEHLLDASASLVSVLLGACPGVKVLATTREPIGVDGEVTFRVPSLSLDDEAVELFANRARLVRNTFDLTDTNRAAVTEICFRLDGMPLAIELAAARVRALSPDEILDGLRDRFHLLTGGARTAVPRQQTLRASVDWSHELLTQPERVLFRRLAVFSGGFDLEAAEVVAAGAQGGADLERERILDTLTLLVDKSLVIAEADNDQTRTRYRLLETMRQYAIEKLDGSGEAGAVHTRHRDFYAGVAAAMSDPGGTGLQDSLARAAVEIDNFRAAFAWSRECSDTEAALTLASSLQSLWLASGRLYEGLAWLDAVLSDDSLADVTPAVAAGALSDRALLDSWAVSTETTAQAERALAAGRESGDPRLLVRALTARGFVGYLHGELAEHYFVEAAELARSLGDSWRLGQVLGQQTNVAFLAGDPNAASSISAEGRELADAIGDRFTSRQCRTWGAWAQLIVGELGQAAMHLSAVRDESAASVDPMWWVVSAHYGAEVAAYQGDSKSAAAALAETAPAAENFGAMWSGNSRGVCAIAALAAGDVARAGEMSGSAWESLADVAIHQRMYGYVLSEVALARGDLVEARGWADEAVSSNVGWHRVLSLTTRARVLFALREPELADRDAYDALGLAADLGTNLGIPDILECLAATARAGGGHARSARLFGAAEGMRRRMGAVRFKVHDADHEVSARATREALGDNDFDAAFAEGSALSTLEAVTYAQRGKGERRRPSMGWSSLTPAERDVVRLVCDGLANKEIAKRLLVSPRTVQTHLTHVYTKLNLTSRVQLVQEASRHDDSRRP